MTINMRVDDWRGRKVVDPDGRKIGKIEDVYYDEADGSPEWALVRTGLLGTRDTFVPLDGARVVGRDIVVPYARDYVKDAPNVDGDDVLSIAEEAQLAAYYERDFSFEGGHLSYSGARRDAGDAGDAGEGGAPGAGPSADAPRSDAAPPPPPPPAPAADDIDGRHDAASRSGAVPPEGDAVGAAPADTRGDDAALPDDRRRAGVGALSSRRMPSQLTRRRWVTVAMPADEAERLGYTSPDSTTVEESDR